ncbi:hypothetical protein PT974_09292 [Cladobotryum mycophilum]|uniref:Uncharacterized protein n=1 Tax=Cladobotryum mycophilum TaxID=491253 RepID=A0ABR0SFW1_9HYPO
MAPSPIVAATLQTAFLGVVSCVLAQAITAYKSETPLAIDWVPVFQYLVFIIVSTPPNFKWQEFLESSFPAHPEPPKPKKADEKKPSKDSKPAPQAPLSKSNTLIKIVLDQTLAATVNTLLYSTFIRSLRYAMPHAPRITNIIEAAKYWSGPGAIDFVLVDFPLVWEESLEEFPVIFFAGLKLWPLIAVINFTLVKSVQGRNLVGGLAGVAWGVYICLMTAA